MSIINTVFNTDKYLDLISKLPKLVYYECITFKLKVEPAHLSENDASICYYIINMEKESKHYHKYGDRWENPYYYSPEKGTYLCGFLYLIRYIKDLEELLN